MFRALKYLLLSIILFANSAFAESDNLTNNKWAFFSGVFDFSDDGKKSTIIGMQHQNENLTRDIFLGTISPVTGFMITADNAKYAYTGIQAEYKIDQYSLPKRIIGISFFMPV